MADRHGLNISYGILDRLFKDFLEPFVEKLRGANKIREWPLWEEKSIILSFFKLFSAFLYKLDETQQDLDPEDRQ